MREIGRLAGVLVEAGYMVRGLDISEPMLDVARRRLGSYGENFICEVADLKKYPSSGPICSSALCAWVLMHFSLDQQIELLIGVAKLSRSVVVINQSLDSGYQRFRRRLKQWPVNKPPARFPIIDKDIRFLLEKSSLQEVKRYRLLPLINEAVYIVAGKI